MGRRVFKVFGLLNLCLLLSFSSESAGRVTVGITINSYTNVNGTCYQEKSSSRKCCDGPQRADCADGDTCDTYFDICVGRMETGWGCKGAFLHTTPLNDTNTIYNASRIDGDSDFWGAGMGVFIFIRDTDSVGAYESHDHIDTLIQILKFDPDPTFDQRAVHQYEWNGNNVEMRISIEAWCSEGFYGSDCQRFCQAIQPVSDCSSETGSLVCMSRGALLLEFQSAVNNSVFPALDVGINRFMDEIVCQHNNSNVQYAQIDSKSRTLTFEGYCNNRAVLPIEFESKLFLTKDTVLTQYFKPDIVRGRVILPRGYGEHIVPNVYVGIELRDVEHVAATSYDGDKRSGERKCCDVPTLLGCDNKLDTCDLEFSICIGETSNGVCIGAVVISPVYDNSTSLFTCGATLLDFTTGRAQVSHPMIGGFRMTKNNLSIQVLIKDMDMGVSSFDIVDVLNTTVSVTPGPNITSAATMDVTMNNFVTLKLRMIFWCTPGHSGPLCTAQNGTDHCENGWSGEECNIPLDVCHPNPCQYNGVCVISQSGAYSCKCSPGYSGQNCTQDVNECQLYKICKNNGSCENSFGAFNCDCKDGWTGLICTEKLPYCNPSPCVNGTCSPVYKPISGYVCKCNQGWSGQNCANKDDCTTSNCIHGNCVIVDGVDICMCVQGYSGRHCTEDIDECLARPCKNDGVCMNTVGSYNCTCLSGFSGRFCEVMPSNCVQNECENQGTCVQNATASYCLCADGYTGSTCDQLVDKCASIQCKHGENCVERFDDFQCNCTQYWSGKTCDIDINECSMSLCQHAVQCINLPGSYYCECSKGWNGTTCDTDINECLSSSQCHNGTCINTSGGYVCQCEPNFTGENCQTATQFCPDSFCNGHGSCSDGVGEGVCTCNSGYTGPRCEFDVNECGLGICGSHSSGCTDLAGSYNCSCKQGWQGINCSQDVNECDTTKVIPCSGNGFCVNHPGSFICNCLTGFSGKLCSKFANTCTDMKCFNGATCEIRDEGPACVCANGWSGLKCETDINECETLPCKNSGTCQNTDGSFLCNCYSGWTGHVCENDVNECLDTTTCTNNGTCSNVLGTYNCSCQLGWQGMSCEVYSPNELQGNVLAFTFKQNITSEYKPSMVTYMYHFLTTYACNGTNDVRLYVQSFVLNIVNIIATCGGAPVSIDIITDGFTRVPNETRPRLFPLAYKSVQQTSTGTTYLSPHENGLGLAAVLGIVLASVVFTLTMSGLAIAYVKRRRAIQSDDNDNPRSPYIIMDEVH